MSSSEDHAAIWAAEMAALAPTKWDTWIDQTEKLVGHSLDGDQDQDGYSMDEAYAFFREGKTPTLASQIIKLREQDARGRPFH